MRQSHRRTAVLAFAAAVTVTVGCGDGVFLPLTVPGYYTLVSVNGRSLPYTSPPSIGFDAGSIWRGDLLLRSDGTFMHGIGGNVVAALYEGTYRLADGELVLSFRFPSALQDFEIIGTVAGNSIVLHLETPGSQLDLSYQRGSANAHMMPSATYRLTSVDGRSGDPVVISDTTINGTRHLGTVSDSLFFIDVFVRRQRVERLLSTTPGGEQLVSETAWTSWGGVDRGPGWVRLVYYFPVLPLTSRHDSLALVGDTLVRRTSLITGIREERYTSR